ncbi:unnamed protein product [Nippostrongylus brasiliensis]|uniref:Glycerol-3-phosphate dehydrogenase n=1 Tax=Nippostrongylus brasiliensis TaxID=27835 RepID=A0A0N4XI00_NIPBR|nr:unnamed protein product [Nippostrongylus brasiliensis]
MFTSRLARAGAAVGLAAAGVYTLDVTNESRFRRQMKEYFRTAHADRLAELNRRPPSALPSRKEIVDSLKAGEEYDVLVIGGGATGAGVALDAQTRGEWLLTISNSESCLT